MKTIIRVKMPRKLKKWYKNNRMKYLFRPDLMSWNDKNLMSKLMHDLKVEG